MGLGEIIFRLCYLVVSEVGQPVCLRFPIWTQEGWISDMKWSMGREVFFFCLKGCRVLEFRSTHDGEVYLTEPLEW